MSARGAGLAPGGPVPAGARLALRPRLIADALVEADRGLIDLSGLWVARRRGRVVGALLDAAAGGPGGRRSGHPRSTRRGARSTTAVALIRAALDDLARAGS